MKWVLLLGLGSIFLLLLGAMVSPLLKSTGRHPITQALSNARQLGLALFDFDSDYSRFPDVSTVPTVQAATHTTLDLNDATSNGLFRQLIAAGITSSEEIFYAKCHGSVKPDNHLGAGALSRGECGFSYILCDSNSVTGSSSRPLIVTPLIPGTLKFDPEPFDGRAVVLRVDNSAISCPIESDGSVRIDGKDLFDPTQPYWGGAKPVVKWPDLPPLSWFTQHVAACLVGIGTLLIASLSVVLLKRRKKHRFPHLSSHASRPLIGLVMAVSCLFLESPSAFARKTPATVASGNVRQIGLALFDFESDYNQFPDDSTIPDVQAGTHTTWDLRARTSNDIFKQLFVTKLVTTEDIFYARCFGARRPDNLCTSADNTLEAGECGFAYIQGASSLSDNRRPLVAAPLIPGTLLFDTEAFEGQAVILYLDNSARIHEIGPDGRVRDDSGKDIFDSSQPYWNGNPPDVKWAELPNPPPALRNRIPTEALIVFVLAAWSGTTGWILLKARKNRRQAMETPC